MSTPCLLPSTAHGVNIAFMKHMMSRLLGRLRELGLSEAEFARAIGESGQAVHNWKKRESIPNDKLAKVAKAVDVTVDWLLTGVSQPSGAMEESAVYNDLPVDLVHAWQGMDKPTRVHLLAIAVALSAKGPRGR